MNAYSGFSVDDIAAAGRFYGGALELRVMDAGPGQAVLDLGGGRAVFVYEKDDHAPAGFTVLNFPVADIDATVAWLAARGVPLEAYPGCGADGVHRDGDGPPTAWFCDPAGNVLSVIEEARLTAAA